jgi:pimeloyl-ACP methyl ester carboxylesterase
MRGYGDSDKPEGDVGYDGAALAEEFRSLVKQTGFGAGRPLTLIAHDMGAPPALLWAAKHPDEIAALLYIEAPVMLQSILENIITFTPQAMAKGSMWWWVLPLAPGVPEALIVGKEGEFLNWFYRGDAVAKHEAIPPETVDEYLRTFAGVEGVLGALGVYRTVFTTMAQTLPLTQNKVQLPVIAIGGEKGLGERVGQFVSMVAANVESVVLPACGHFVPEECPEAVLEQLARLPDALAALDIAQVVHTFGMVLWLTIHDAVERLQFVVGGKDGVNIGAAPIGKLDPELEADGWYGHRDISWTLIPSRSGRSRISRVDSWGAKGGAKTLGKCSQECSQPPKSFVFINGGGCSLPLTALQVTCLLTGKISGNLGDFSRRCPGEFEQIWAFCGDSSPIRTGNNRETTGNLTRPKRLEIWLCVT